MKQIKIILALGVLLFSLSSCEEEICIHCFPIGENHESPNMVEFCSTDRNARMDFQVQYIDKSYNCLQAGE
jgi:hypothetical protein